MKVSMIACVDSETLGIGFEGDLLYQIPDDLKRFKQLTEGFPIIMGRKTFNSLKKTLPNRKHYIVTRDHSYKMPSWAIASQCTLVGSLEAAFKLCQTQSKQCFVIGGEQLYEQALPVTSEIFLTLARETSKKILKADAFFPDIDDSQFNVKFGPTMRFKSVSYNYVTLTRKGLS